MRPIRTVFGRLMVAGAALDAAGCFVAMSVIKLMHWRQTQANRVIREEKRLQLQVARGQSAV